MIVGGFAVAFHGHPRFTGDLDILVRNSAENADRLQKVLFAFGFGSVGLSASDFLAANQIIQLGRSPNRIDVLTTISGVEFDEVWADRVAGSIEDNPVFFISRKCLIKNKQAADRARDRADLKDLGFE